MQDEKNFDVTEHGCHLMFWHRDKVTLNESIVPYEIEARKH